MIKVVDGNVLNAKEEIICHQVNCQGKMGSGLARQVKMRFPNAYERYKEVCDKIDQYDLLGRVQVVKCEDKYVANVFGQLSYGRDKRHTDYVALDNAFASLGDYMKNSEISSIAFPFAFGCGLGGGRWEEVYGMIEEYFSDFDTVIYKY